MKFLLVTFGSRGDVHPMLALGQALHRRGHQVILMTNPVFQGDAHQAGLDFIAIGTEDQYRQTLAHPRLWHPIDGLGVMWRYLLRPALRPTYKAIERLAADVAGGEQLLVIASPMAMGARIAQEKLGLKLVSSYTAGTLLRSVENPLTMAQWRVPAAIPRWTRHALWKLLDLAKLNPLVKPALESLRAELGLAPLRASVFGTWFHSPLAGLTLFPPWFAPAAADWPPQVHSGDFPLYDDHGASSAEALGPALAQFLDAGPAPLVFMPGSAQQGTAAFFDCALQATHQLKLRAVLLGQGAAQAAAGRCDCLGLDYHPFGALLPRAQAIVHHGGVGTCAQALRAGLPQLVCPQAYDQFDNAMRLEQLGVGLQLGPKGLTPQRMAEGLQHLLASAAVRQACARQAQALSPEAGTGKLDAACRLLEQLA